jgi:hypothetical protein
LRSIITLIPEGSVGQPPVTKTLFLFAESKSFMQTCILKTKNKMGRSSIEKLTKKERLKTPFHTKNKNKIMKIDIPSSVVFALGISLAHGNGSARRSSDEQVGLKVLDFTEWF